ncbi:AAA domain (dynein-related subfamily) domain-containing protein [Ditylenchus destructor]|nr:AAA domain (dynein-related subfamily) domain-containing protein [Ditylenchus destructor]
MMARKKSKRSKLEQESACPVPVKTPRPPPANSLEERNRHIDELNKLLSSNILAIITGPICCGKSHIAKQAAALRQLPVVVVQINDELDSKTVFGSYNCTDIPGEFEWIPSTFAKALQEETLILLEDLHNAHADLISAVLSLGESGEYISSNSSMKHRVNERCRIVATIDSSEGSSANHLIRNYPYFIELPPLEICHLSDICALQFPEIADVKEKVLDTFCNLCSTVNHKSSCNRMLNNSDLFRLCKRLQQFSNFNNNAALLMEMYDVWTSHISDKEMRLKATSVISAALSVAEEQMKFFLDARKPDIQLNESILTVGRTNLPRENIRSNTSSSFALTGSSCRLMERVAVCISQRSEAVLLTGETGVGKTSVIQLLASYTGATLKVINLSQDSEYSDLIGGFKPVSLLHVIQPLVDDYLRIFKKAFDPDKNKKFIDHILNCLSLSKFETLLHLIRESATRAQTMKQQKKSNKWARITQRSQRMLDCFFGDRKVPPMPFAYVRGIVAEAAESGYWLLVDEINLASSECLDAIIQTLDSGEKLHPNFRLFACMNPATDVGKRVLPSKVRTKFTEFYVEDTTDREELAIIVKNYLPDVKLSVMNSILDFYQEIRKCLPRRYSLRTFCRALALVRQNLRNSFNASLLIGYEIAFTSNLDADEQAKLIDLLKKYFGSSKTAAVCQTYDKKEFIEIEGSLIRRGSVRPQGDSRYVFTPSVTANLSFLASVVSSGRLPILLEGETSAGKTSIIQHLAKATGNRVFRINNHEHTDVQEYIGNYRPSEAGQLEFSEGVLVKAVRNGDWIILDELNLAPPAVLEALNRLLDDNREIFVPELNRTYVAHPRFQLFATQNPVGSYAGRKRLSRAFLNRFIVIKYDHLPFPELPQIVEARCGVSSSMAKIMVEVLVELKSRRSVSGVFSFSNGLMTLRDLFRWGNRAASCDENDYDWRQTLADQGYFVLGSRCRNVKDEKIVIEILEKHFKRKIDPKSLFSSNSKYMPKSVNLLQNDKLVPTFSMCRMLVLCSEAWRCNEAVLMVGETGCGKTTCAHVLARDLFSINCNERTETSDFLGNIRPTHDGKFQWNDGIVLQAMKSGDKLLIDEISLAPDSVLERLNSLLEPDRTILLTDSGPDTETVIAHSNFQIIATMNPGDDYGKKELSKALRNRFLEVWCPYEPTEEDMRHILEKNIAECNLSSDVMQLTSSSFLEFFKYFRSEYEHLLRHTLTTRDLVAIAQSFSSCVKMDISIGKAIQHAISANLLDALGVVQHRVAFDRVLVAEKSHEKLLEILRKNGLIDLTPNANIFEDCVDVIWGNEGLKIGDFVIPYGPLTPDRSVQFSFDAPTAKRNSFRVARGLISSKPVMLEGSPGAGKSSLIVALAAATGNQLFRLNLSEQTDLCDLFGSDVPVQGGDGKISFAWKDGPVLTAIKQNAWILLDEMNLASQAVLEGLNSCFDFRKNLFISQLNKSFDIESTKCRFFSCQNPRSQGGDRKALPKSFLNRFTSIFVDEMTAQDYEFIISKFCGKSIPENIIIQMVAVNSRVRLCGIQEGGPFEFNLRDLLRWCAITINFGLRFGFELVYLSRIRNDQDICKARSQYDDVFGSENAYVSALSFPTIDSALYFGPVAIHQPKTGAANRNNAFLLLASQTSVLQKIGACVSLPSLIPILIGGSNVGKQTAVEIVANLASQKLLSFRLTEETDALELLGTYEQVAAEGESGGVQFKWVNSDFVRAYREGWWILIEDVNCCSSAVLDCLNACLEEGGELMIPGHAVNQPLKVKKHVDFRVFFTMDPSNGPLSRAMRNRGIEIFFGTNYSWNRDINDALSITFNEVFPSEAKPYSECIAKQITVTSPRDMLRARALEMPFEDSDTPLKAMRISRPLFGATFDEFGKILPSYYWYCWYEVSKFTTDPIPAYVLALLTLLNISESRELVSTFANIGEATKNAVKKLLLSDRATITRLPICNLFSIDTDTSTLSMSGFQENLIDLLSVVRALHDSEITAKFHSLFDSRETELQQDHSAITLREFRLCYGFESAEDFSRLSKYPLPFDLPRNDDSAGFISNFVEQIHDFLRALSVLYHGTSEDMARFPNFNLLSFRSVSWLNPNSMNSYLLLELMNFSCPIHISSRLNMLNFLSLPCFVTAIVNKFWSFFGFSSAVTNVSLSHMADLASFLPNIGLLTWKLYFLRDDLYHMRKSRLRQLAPLCLKEYANSDEESLSVLRTSIISSMELLKNVTPPLDLIDPIVADRARLDYYNESVNYIDTYFASIRHFATLTIGSYDEASENHFKHPVLCELRRAKQMARASVEELKTRSASSQIHRPSVSKFPNLVYSIHEFKNYASRSIESLLSSHSILESLLNRSDASPSEAARVYSQLKILLQTCESFKKQLIENFAEYPDIITIFISVNNCLLLCLRRLQQKMRWAISKMELNKKRNFTKVFDWIREQAFVEWVTGEESTLSFPLQLEAVLYHISLRQKSATNAVKWATDIWKNWYERNSEKKMEMYVHKSRAKEGESTEQDAMDPDLLEFRSYLPIIEQEDDDSDQLVEHTGECNASQVFCAVKSILRESYPNEDGRFPYYSLLKIIDDFQLYDGISEDEERLLSCHHLTNLRSTANSITKEKGQIINVYGENQLSELSRCLAAISPLQVRVQQIHEEFPENQVLIDLLEAIQKFCSLSANTPLARFASSLERVLCRVNEWQKLADRKHSIIDLMETLQQILTDWRKLEVESWANTIERIESDYFQLAVLSSWPLLETIENMAENSKDLTANENKVIIMLIDWIQTSSLIDFHARLYVGELMARFVQIQDSGFYSNKFSSNFPSRILSTIRHFESLSGRVKEKVATAKSSAQQKLNDFIRIFKYSASSNSLLNMKSSNEKAHAQMSRIVRTFKEECTQSASRILLDELPQLSTVPFQPSAELVPIPTFNSTNANNILVKIQSAAVEIRKSLSELADPERLESLRTNSESVLTLLQSNISYEGLSDDEAKEKAQGRALFERQKSLARLFRDLAAVGLNYRLGAQVNSEPLTMNVLSNVPVLIDNFQQMENVFRCAVVSRNLFLRKFATVKMQQQEHLKKQVPVHVLPVFKGVTEYGLHYIFNALQMVAQNTSHQSSRLKLISADLDTVFRNQMILSESENVNYALMEAIHQELANDLTKAKEHAELVQKILRSCPSQADRNSFDWDALDGISSAIGTNKLINMYRESAEYADLEKDIEALNSTINHLLEQSEACKRSHSCVLELTSIKKYLSTVVIQLSDCSESALASLSNCFPNETSEIEKIFLRCISRAKKPAIIVRNNSKVINNFECPTSVLLCVQHLIHGMSPIAENPKKLLDTVKQIIELFHRADVEKAISDILEFKSKSCNSHISTDALRSMVDLSNAFEWILSAYLQIIVSFLSSLALLYLTLEAIACRIIDNGLVNPIPNPAEGSTDQSKTERSDGENCGMGEGTADGDAKDVSNQIESLDQVEGLKNENEEENNVEQSEQANQPNDENQPIEMDDDFSANIEDIDGEQDMEDQEGENEEDFENQIEWDKGEVEKSDETQLDPKLWNQEKEEAEGLEEGEAPEPSNEKDSVARSKDQQNQELDEEGKDAEGDEEENDQGGVDQDLEQDSHSVQMDDDFAVNLEGMDDEPDGEGDQTDDSPELENQLAPEIEEENGDADEEKQVDSDALKDTANAENETQTHGEEETTDVGKSSEMETLEKPESQQNDKTSGHGVEIENDDNDKIGAEESENMGESKKKRQSLQTKNDTADVEKQKSDSEKLEIENEELQRTNVMAVDEPDRENVEDANDIEDGESDEEGDQIAYRENMASEFDKHVVRSSTVEEAMKTKDLFRRQAQNRTDIPSKETPTEERMEVEEEVETLSFSRHKHLTENHINFSFDKDMRIFGDSSADITSLLEKVCQISGGETDQTAAKELKWALISDSVSVLASMLAESLRMILEPTIASKLQGDYRTGKRLNVRRLLAYVASDYRKDRIWMRRTKKVKRNFHICIAVDDSASMKDNLMTEITCHGLCLIEKALRQLEIGKLSVCKFGKSVKILSDFASSESDHLHGATLLSELTFKQDKTDLANLLQSMRDHFDEARQESASADQMLIILSDGRGVLSDGLDRIRTALSRLIDGQVTVLFIIIDNGEKSIMEIKVANFTADGDVTFDRYMEHFPFPFFAIVNEVSMLPNTIAEAVRQWFEYTCH